MSKPKTKLVPDVMMQGRLNSNDKDFQVIMDVVSLYPNRNVAVLEGLRALARLAPRFTAKQETSTDTSPAILAQFDVLNERIDTVINKLNYLQSQGYSPQIINAAMSDSNEDIDPALADEIRAQFLANNS